MLDALQISNFYRNKKEKLKPHFRGQRIGSSSFYKWFSELHTMMMIFSHQEADATNMQQI